MNKTFDLYGFISLIRDVGGLGCSFFKVSSTTIESQRTKTEGDLISDTFMYFIAPNSCMVKQSTLLNSLSENDIQNAQ